MMEDYDNYEKEVICTYRDETYSVRDNGAIYRHRKSGSRLRQLDEQWTFGRLNEKRGYMYFAGIMVHQIVATAFHGQKPSKNHIVDHKDTNRRNNWAENLQWVTRLDNILLNPITRRRVEIAYGSIENFLKNPAKPIKKLEPNFEWMRNVTKKEAKESYKHLLDWSKRDNLPKGEKLGDWLYSQQNENKILKLEPVDPIDSLISGAVQKNWNTPTKFPLCPPEISKNTLNEYLQHLTKGEVFALNKLGETIVHSVEFSTDSDKLLVLGTNSSGAKKWSVARVSIDNQLLIHESIGTFFTYERALKQFTIERGLEWKGGDTFDDYC